MRSQVGYKKYMKKKTKKDNSFLSIFLVSFFGMLLVFTFIIKSFVPTVDTSIGDYTQEQEIEVSEPKKVVDGRLADIQNEDQGKTFSEIMDRAAAIENETIKPSSHNDESVNDEKEDAAAIQAEPIYKVFIGSYTSIEQARVAKDIILESNNGLNPIVKCLGSNNFTLQVGIFKNKDSADSLLYVVQQNHLPGRIVQDY